jgi:hypothetical protein
MLRPPTLPGTEHSLLLHSVIEDLLVKLIRRGLQVEHTSLILLAGQGQASLPFVQQQRGSFMLVD